MVCNIDLNCLKAHLMVGHSDSCLLTSTNASKYPPRRALPLKPNPKGEQNQSENVLSQAKTRETSRRYLLLQQKANIRATSLYRHGTNTTYNHAPIWCIFIYVCCNYNLRITGWRMVQVSEAGYVTGLVWSSDVYLTHYLAVLHLCCHT